MPSQYAAGILAFARHKGTALVLLGKDVRVDAGYSDMGGKVERVDKADVIVTACREFYEETCGVLYDATSLRRYITPHTAIVLKSHTQNNYPYFTFLIEVPFVPSLRSQYQKIVNYLRFRSLMDPKSAIFQKLVEKHDIQYVPARKLFDNSFHRRTIFAETVNMHRDVIEDVIAGLEGGDNWRDICARYPWDTQQLA